VLKGGGTLGLVTLAGCGGASSASSNPGGPSAGATPTPTPTPTPAPTPTPTPAATPTPSAPAGDSVVFRLTIKIEHVVGVDGKTRLTNPNPSEPLYVGEIVRLDATAKTVDNRATDGSGEVYWRFGPEGIIDWSGAVTFNPRLQIVGPGQLSCRAVLDGVVANDLTLNCRAFGS
jgi:hypothetical protein